MTVFNHLLHEDALDRLVAGTYVAGAESMNGQHGDDESDRQDRGNGWKSSGHQYSVE